MNTGEFTIVVILPSYRIAFLILIFSVNFQKNNLKLICWLAIWMRFVTLSVRIHKQQLKFNLLVTNLEKQLMNWAILPKTEGKSSVQKEMKLQKKSVMVEFKVVWQLVRLRHPKFIILEIKSCFSCGKSNRLKRCIVSLYFFRDCLKKNSLNSPIFSQKSKFHRKSVYNQS